MQLTDMIRDLRREKQQLDQIIALFENLQTNRHIPKAAGGRGRKFMTTQQRREVSKRMKEYWAKRRDGRKSASKRRRRPKTKDS
jgi:hypothetical protein